MRNIKGLVAWVTGGGSGIGRATAIELANAGATVIVSGRRQEPLVQTVALINTAAGSADFELMDLAEKQQCYRAAERIMERHGQVDILVNNAATNLPTRHWHSMQDGDFEHVINTNINGIYHCTQAVLPTMRKNSDGLVINIASWAAVHNTYLSGAAYSTSKAALRTLTDTLNMEEGHHGIRATAISPAEVATPFAKQRVGGAAAEGALDIALQPEDVGETIAFVAQLPVRACINDLVISPSNNRWYTLARSVGN
ncbi:SDR family oxidoreductase [Parahaliea mediterranea]|uniref:SDR family oxidoreductase n=1 Tax=Parahaliea mediterranea TaxID=651086 RepID=UPI000E2E7C47|nr:SDR family oxidoreductase [Parahaliea mediterranea]